MERRDRTVSKNVFPWSLTPAQQELLDWARAFATTEIEPRVDEAESAGCLPSEIQPRFHDSGIATRFLEESPGDDFVVSACLLAEELSYSCASFASHLMLPVFFNRIAASFLAAPERDEFLDRCRKEPVITSFAASEAAAGSDLLALETTATRTANGYVLRGRKEYSSNLRAAHYVIVVARTGPASVRSTDSMSWFLVPTNAPGVSIGRRWPTFGLRALDISPLELDDVEIPAAFRLGGEGRGLPMMAGSLSMSRIGIAALGVGIARRTRDAVFEHGRQRRIYGDKLNRMQDYRFRIAAMERDIAAARALVWVAARRADSGEDPGKEASIAKLFSGEMVMSVTTAASGMLGSIGYTGQSRVEKLLRDGRHVGIVEGPAPTHKELIFAHMLRHGAY